MKKVQQWFNDLPLNRRKLILAGFCLVFMALLLLSIRYQALNLHTGRIIQPRIMNDTSKHK